MCATHLRRDYLDENTTGLMELGLFERIMEQCSGLKKLHLQGLGEPLLHPHFFDMVALASRKNIEVTASSNLTLLSRRTAGLCVSSGLRCLHVSVDGATPATYERVRAGGSFSRVLANLVLLSQAKEICKSRYPVLKMTVVVMRQNLHEIPGLVRLAGDFGVEEIFVQHLCHSYGESTLPEYYMPMRGFFRRESLAGEDPEKIRHYFTVSSNAAASAGILLRLPRIGISEEKEASRRLPSCDWPFTGIYISYQGRVMPCCMISTPDRATFGSAEEDDLSDIWNGELYDNFRRLLASGQPPEICRSCSVYNGTF
jgi:radical SAM protein with 4Fe4S-binding SPASM domain